MIESSKRSQIFAGKIRSGSASISDFVTRKVSLCAFDLKVESKTRFFILQLMELASS